MIVVAIIGTLAAVAIPAYQRYVIRAQVLEAVSLYRTTMLNTQEFYYVNERLPKAEQVPHDHVAGDLSFIATCTETVRFSYYRQISATQAWVGVVFNSSGIPKCDGTGDQPQMNSELIDQRIVVVVDLQANGRLSYSYAIAHSNGSSGLLHQQYLPPI